MDVRLLLKNQISNTELKFSYDTDLENGTYDCQGRRIRGGDTWGVWNRHVHIALF